MDAREYAKEHHRFLKETRPDVLKGLQADPDGLTNYLSSVGKQAQSQYEALLAQMNNDPQVQSLPYHQKVSAFQNHQQSAAEIVRANVIHQPIED